MKKSDLYREWARVLDMCEGTNVRPEDCWKFGVMLMNEAPALDDHPDYYSFAVAIVEDKPVFVGDKVYGKNTGDRLTAIARGWSWWCKESEEYQLYPFETPFALSWEPPKKTFRLKGEDLPCPVLYCDNNTRRYLTITGANGVQFTFHNKEDRDKVADALIKLLKDATK